MSWFGENSVEARAHEEVMNAPHKAKLSHELIAAAASYEAAKAYEDHCIKHGEPDTHAKAKEILAALSGGFIDSIVETKGLDYVDSRKVKGYAREHLTEVSAQEY